MITVKEIKAQHNTICHRLAKKRVKDSLDLLQGMTRATQNGDLIDAHYNLEFTYKNILRYTVEGISDPERQKVYNHLVKDVFNLADKAYALLMEKQSNDLMYEFRREHSNTDFGGLLAEVESLIKSHELKLLANPLVPEDNALQSLYIKAFQYIFSATPSAELNDQLQHFFKAGAYPWHFKALLVAAINLSLTAHFSIHYLQLLLDLAVHPDDRISARALTGLILAFAKYDARLPLYPDLFSRFFLMVEEKNLAPFIQSLTIQLIRTRETERISKKLHDEIIPEVVKMQPKLKDKLDLENLLKERTLDDKNPDWENVFKDSPNLISKMEELTQWQMEGADVFLSTFQHLKHFSFFSGVANWLLPFYHTHPEVIRALENESDAFKNNALLEKLGESRFLCNSDKYSLILSIPHMPSMQKELMSQMFSAEIEQMAELTKDEEALKANQSKLMVSNQYIQDLYRVSKIHPQKKFIQDAFDQPLDFHNKWFYKQVLGDLSSMRELGEYYFKKNYFDEAIELFKIVLLKEPASIESIQKVAFCHQKMNNYDEALKYYLKADLLGGESAWNKRKIAICYRQLRNPEMALKYFKEVELLQPDNLQNQASIGNCYLELEQFEEALKCYFKVEYLDPGNAKVGRPIAWCSFVLGKFDQAEKYYHTLLVSDNNKHDLINMGHTLWCKKQRKEALASYQKSIKLPNHSFDQFLETFTGDVPYLKQNGIDSQDIPLMLDQIRYSLED